MRFTRAKTKREAIVAAIQDFNRRRRMAELVKHAGTCEDMMSVAELQKQRRKGDPAVRARVERALQAGEACWCPMVRLELWNGAGGDREKKVLRDFEKLLPELQINTDVWHTAHELARRARASGVSVPATNLLIAACAKHHGANLEHSDSDFNPLADL